MENEEEKMRALKGVVDECARALSEDDLSPEQAHNLVEETRGQVLALFPDKADQFELIYRPRFERIIRERGLK